MQKYVHSVGFRTLADMQKAANYLISQCLEKIEIYSRDIPQITFAETGRNARVNLAFFCNDNGIKCTWIGDGLPVENSTWQD